MGTGESSTKAKQPTHIDIESVGRKASDCFRRRFPVNYEEQREEAEIEAKAATEAKHPEHDAPPDATKAKVHPRLGPVQLVGERVGMLGKLKFEDARELAESVIQRYAQERVDAGYVLYNEFKSVIAQRLVVEQVLPIKQIGVADIQQSEELMTLEQKADAVEVAGSAGVQARGADTSAIDQHAAAIAAAGDYIYEQSPKELFNSLLPKYVAMQVYRAMVESVAAEHAARMTAMDSATNNASDMIDSLTLKMNRARQASITKEIIEIVSGAATL